MSPSLCIASIDFVDGTEAILVIRAKVVDYFNIPVGISRLPTYRRGAYTYHRSDGLRTANRTEVRVPKTQSVKTVEWTRRRGRKVRIPTERVTKKGYTQTLGITFPRRMTYRDIGYWLFLNCRAHRPKYFLTEAGKKRIVFDFASMMDVEDEG
jgi:hypothetical protein